MGRRVDPRDEFVVECRVEGIAVLSVHADSPAEACATAELQVKAADVSELSAVEALRVVRVSGSEEERHSARVESAPERPSTGSGHGGGI